MNSLRELDYRVAELVMGWRWWSDAKGRQLIPPVGTHGESYIVPYYSVVLNMAWEVLETLRLCGFSVDVNCYPAGRKWLKPIKEGDSAPKWQPQTSPNHYQCTVAGYDNEFDCWIVVCDPVGSSPAEVICLAALEVVKPK
jgi:hypothetical protein